jgi:hypothetical protein
VTDEVAAISPESKGHGSNGYEELVEHVEHLDEGFVNLARLVNKIYAISQETQRMIQELISK